MPNLLHEVRRVLTEDPDLAIINGRENKPATGWCFLFHEDAGFLKARRMGKTHWELVDDWTATQFPELSSRARQSLTDVERLKVKWSGRWWEEGDQLYIAFWEHEKFMPVILDQFADEAPLNASDALYQCWDHSEDEWFTFDQVMERNPSSEPLPTVNPITARKVAEIRTELHTATPERKAILRSMLKVLTGEDDAVDVAGLATGRAGFRSPVEMNYALRQESTDRSVSTKGLPQNFRGVSLKQDEDGFYVCTHRCRSDSYPSADKIPQSKIDYIETTG